ncbi:MAG: YitT family protein [Collinsella sp.]
MAYRLDIKRILSLNFFHDLPKIMLGCALAAIATDLFLIPNGLAAGGVTGLATIIQAVGASHGISLPVGIQTIVMNALLLLVVMREGGMFYVVQTATGFVLLGFFTDLFAPFVAPLAHADLMLPAMWGGIITGIGYGVIGAGCQHWRSDTIGQIISRNTSLPVGSTVMAIDVASARCRPRSSRSKTRCMRAFRDGH